MQMGLPNFWSKKGGILTIENYRHNLFKVRESDENFDEMTVVIRGQTIVDSLIDDLCLLWQIKKLFLTAQTYDKYTELDIAYRKMVLYQYTSNEDWKLLFQLIQE
jgi:hypothetical protein